MSPIKALIAEAVSRFPLQSIPEWQTLARAGEPAEVERIETNPLSISTVDCLFDGKATIFLKDARALQATVFGRFDGRRAEVERIVLAA